jgi:uncharacterized protein
MFLTFLDELRRRRHSGQPEGASGASGGAGRRSNRSHAGSISTILPRATYVKDEGLLDRFDQVFAKVFRGIATTYGHPADRDSRRLAEGRCREIS